MILSSQNKVTWFKSLQLLIFVILNSSTNVYSEVEIPYTSDFESGEGYVDESPLSGDWTTTDNSIVITNDVAYSGTQSVHITSASPENIISLSFNPSGSSILFVDYYMQLTASTLPELPSFTAPETTAILAVQPYLSDSGEWVFLNGDGSGSGLWRTSGESVPLDAADRTGWHRITLRFDLLSNSWDVYIDDRLLAVNLGFVEALVAGSEAINIYGNSADVSYVDAFSLTSTNPLFTDDDLDGMEDDFEVQNGLDASVNDRDSDLDGDGLSNIEEYRLGFDPSVQDVDTVVNLPANGALTVVDDVNGNVRITNDGVVLLDKPIGSIYNLSIFGSENAGDIDILLDGTLNGLLEIEGDVGTVTFNSLLTILGGLKIKNVENLLLYNMLEVHDDALINVSKDFKLDFSGSLIVIGGDLDCRENMRDPGIKGDLTVSGNSEISVTAGSAFFNVVGAIWLDDGSRFAVKNVPVAPGDMLPQLQLNSNKTITISDNSSIHSSNNNMSLSAQEYISLVDNSAVSAAENGFVSIQTNSGDFTVVDSSVSLNNNDLFLYMQGLLRVVRSTIDLENGIAQFITFVDATVEENSSLTVTGGDLFGQINRNLTVSDNSEIAATEGNIGLNVIGNALIEGASQLEAQNLEISGDNAESVAKKLQLIVSGTTTFDSGSTLALKNTELVIFSFDNIDLFDSTLSVLTGADSLGDIEASIRTNGNLSLTESTLSMDGSNLFVNAAQSMYITGSDVTATDGNLYLNTRIDTIMDADSTLSVTGGDLYTNVFGEAILAGPVNIENVFSAYVQGNFTLTEIGSLDAFTILLSSGRNIAIDGRMDTWMGTSQGDGRVFMNAQGSIYMKSLDPIIAEELFVISVTGIFLRTDVDTLTAQTTGIGLGSDLNLGNYTGSAEIEIHEVDDIRLNTVYSADGPIRVMAGGTIQAGQIISATDAPGHNIGLMSTGGDLEAGSVSVGATYGQVSLSASGTIRELTDGVDGEADIIGNMAVIYEGSSVTTEVATLERSVNEEHLFAASNPNFQGVIFDTAGDVEIFMSTGNNTIDIGSTQGDVIISHATSAVGEITAESPNGSVYIGYLDPGVVGGDEIFVTMSEDGVPNDFELVLKSTDLAGDNLNWSIHSNGSNGVASVEEPAVGNTATINYSPELNFNGNDSFVVQVADNNGNTENITVNVTIEPFDNQLRVRIDTPSNRQTFFETDTVTLAATVVDSDNTIVQVEFLANSVLLGVDTEAPFSFDWSGMASGSYSLEARATNDLGVVSVSALITVSVEILDQDQDGLSDLFEQQIVDADLNDEIDSIGDVLPGDDFDGDGLSNQEEFDRGSDPTNPNDPSVITTLQSSPADGEIDVAVTRETILRFSNPLDPNNVIDNTVVFAEFGGQELAARIQVAADLDTISLFYDEPLPPSARVRVTVNGDQLLDASGRPVDADGDGVPGGVGTIDFDTLTLTLVPGTSICGRVFASELTQMNGVGEWVNNPLEGVTVSVDGAEDTLFAVTDSLGDFRLDPAPAGKFFVHLNGRTATNNVPAGAYYANVGKAYTSIPGQETTIGEVFLPLVTNDTLQPVSETEDTIIDFPDSVLAENPDLAGVSITVPAGSLFANDGTTGGSVGIAPVDPNRLPGTLPDELNFPLVITVQTDGATNFDEPAPICFPNLPDPDTGEILPPGAKTGLWSFNHDAARWEVVGPMTVSADGTLICSDPGVGILAPGWHGTGPGSPGSGGEEDESEEPPPCDKNDPEQCDTSCSDNGDTNPVLLYSGEKYEQVIDLRIKGVGMDFIWARSYSSKIQPVTVQGHGWDFNYNIFLLQDGSGLRLCNGAGRDDAYRPIAGQANKWSRKGFFRQIEMDENDAYRIVRADRSIDEFHPFDGSPQEGKIIRKTDRNGNEMQFFYDAQGRLNEVLDTLGRSIDIAYNADGFIESVTDFIGRSVTYDYYQNGDADGSFGDLKSVTSPAVTGTPTGNDFPDGKTTTYTYSKGFQDDRLNHNLLTITDGRRNDSNDPTFGDGPYLVNVYSATTDPDNLNYDRVIRQIWGGDIVDIHYEFQAPSAENNNAKLKVTLNDRAGNVSETFYDVGNRKVLLREYTGRADPMLVTTGTQNRPVNKLRSDDPDFYQTRYEYNANYLQTRIIYPNGTITENVYESDLNPAASPRTQGNLRIKRRLPGGHTPVGDQTVIEEYFEYDSNFGCGNCGFQFVTKHTDGRGNDTLNTYDSNGNLLTRTHRIASIVEEWEYNAFGQVTAHIWPADDLGRRQRDEYTYHDSGIQRGYQHEEIIDAENLALTTTYTYDSVGNAITMSDPRGNTWNRVYNQLDQLIRTIEPAPYSWFTDTLYDANNNVIETRRQNLVPALTANDKPQLDANGNVIMQTGTPATFVNRYEYEILNNLVTEDLDATGSNLDRLITQYAYDGNRNTILITQPEGNQIQILYDERDLALSTTRGFGSTDASTVTYAYDGNRNRVAIIDAEDNTGDGLPETSRFDYDGYNRLVREIDPIGNVCEYGYDANHNQLEYTCFGPVGGSSPTNADGTNNVLLSQTVWLYDPIDRMVQTDRLLDVSDGVTTARTPVLVDGSLSPGDGWVTEAIVYNDRSQVVETFEDDGDSVTYTYDTANRRITATDPEGNTVEMVYDANSNTVQTIETDRSQVNSGVLDEVITTTFTYDALNRGTQMVDNVGNVTTYAFDSRSNQTIVEDAEGNTTETVYDGANRLIAKMQVMRIGGAGDAAIDTTEAGDGYITASYQYDGNSRLQSFTDDNGNRKIYTYDDLNRVDTCTYGNVVDPALADRQDAVTTEEWVYDKDDNLITFTDQNRTVHTYKYDGLNRQVQRSVSVAAGNPFNLSGTTLQTVEYDGLGRKTRCTDNNDPGDADDDIVCAYVYDTLSRVLEEGQSIGTLPARVTTQQYDNSLATAGNLQSTAMVYPDGRGVEQTYDANNRIQSIADGGQTPIIAYDYIGSGNRVERKILQNGVVTNMAYDGIRRVLNQETRTSASGLIVGFEHGYDQLHNKLYERKLHDLNNSELYAYDSAYRLRKFERGNLSATNNSIAMPTLTNAVLQAREWSLDGLGNWDVQTFTLQGDSTTTSTRTDTNFNEIATLDGITLLHDDNGNQTDNADKFLYEWDALNRLKVVRNRSDNAVIAQYDYDCDNRRMRKTVSNRGSLDGTTHYYYNGWRVCEELAWFGTAEMLLYQYVWGATYMNELVVRDNRIGVTIAQLNDGTGSERQFQHIDTLYSIFAVTDENEGVLERYQYDPYGTRTILDASLNVLMTSTIDQEYAYTGHRSDLETGLYYCANRYFDSEQGRWLSRDPLENAEFLPEGPNLYGYVGNNPINYLDPTGEWLVISLPPVALTVGAGILLWAAWELSQELSPVIEGAIDSICESRSNSGKDKSRQSKPVDAPSGTVPIDQSDLDREDIHIIKPQIDAGPKDYVGVTPSGDVVTTNPEDGTTENHGPVDSYLP